MITHILLDADGVAIKAHQYYSEVYARKHNLSMDIIQSFFNGKFQDCKIGKADLKIEFAPYLKSWNPNETVGNYLQGNFEYELHGNEEVLTLVNNLKSQDIKFYIVTDQEKYRAEYIRHLPEFQNIFENMFFSYELGISKESPEFFQKVLQQLNIPANQVAFWDDEQENVDSAKSTGIYSFFYTSLETFRRDLSSLGIDSNS